MDILDELKDDHKAVSDLFKEIEKTGETNDAYRRSIFREIRSKLELHTRIEETIFYPRLEGHEETDDIVREAEEEHKIVKELLDELSAMHTVDEQWNAKLTVLQENVEHHVKEEEGELFKKAKKVLNKDEREVLGEKMIEMKAKAGEPQGQETLK